MNKILEIKNLSVSYGVIKALKNINISVNEGSIVAILGANGGGKTTLLKKISGLISSNDGVILFENEDITKLAPEKITKKGIIQAPEGRQIFGDLTVNENLTIGAFTLTKKSLLLSKIYDETINKRLSKRIALLKEELKTNDFKVPLTVNEIKKNNLERVYKYFPVLKERKDQIAESLSGGEQQMLAIARALMGSPKLLILDEPSLGLAPLIVKNIFEIIKELNKEGTTVLIVEQNALQTLKIADYAYVIQVGTLIKEGNAKELANDPQLIEAYLGK